MPVSPRLLPLLLAVTTRPQSEGFDSARRVHAGGLPALSGLVVFDAVAWLSLGLQEMASLIGQVAAATPALAAGVAAVVPGRGRACTVGGGAGNQHELRCYQADFPYFHDVVLYCLACPAAALKEPVKPDTQA